VEFIEEIATRSKRRVTAEGFALDGCEKSGGESLIEEEAVGGWAENDGRPALTQECDLPGADRESVDEDGTVVKEMEAIKLHNLVTALWVGAFGGVDDERRVGGSALEARNDIRIERERVSPAEIIEDTYGKAGYGERGIKRVVMADGSDACKEITDSTPPEAGFKGNLKVLRDRMGVDLMNLSGPLGGVEEG
jgi:hypothetical protein